MYRFLETFRISSGRIENIEEHHDRIRTALKEFWPDAEEPAWVAQLETLIPAQVMAAFSGPGCIGKGRLLWGSETSPAGKSPLTVEPYLVRRIHNLVVVKPDILPDYRFKYADRTCFSMLSAAAGPDNEILILDSEGRITDTSYTNLLFSDGSKLFTPATPLLAGTRRSRLIKEGLIHEEILTLKDLKKFKTVHLINAMLPPGALILPVDRIIF